MNRQTWQHPQTRRSVALKRLVERVRQQSAPCHHEADTHAELSGIVQQLVGSAKREHGLADSMTVAVVAAGRIRELQRALRDARYRDLGLGGAA